MKAPAALLEVPLLAIAERVRPPTLSLRPALMDSLAIPIIHTPECGSPIRSCRRLCGTHARAAIWAALACVLQSELLPPI